MKKVLALILTAAMLFSCMIVGISAAREHATNVETTTVTDKAATNSANFCGLRYNDPYYTDNYTFSITMKSCTADFGQMADNVGFCDGVPIINMVAGTIGWNGQSSTVSYNFADNTWYKIDYVVDGNTTIYVNGAVAGTIDAAMPGNLYGSFYASYVTEIYYKQGSDYALYEDFEGGNDPVFSTDVTTFENTTTNVSYENYNVTYNKIAAATNTANFCGLRYNDPYYTDNYTAKFVMKSCTADFGQMADNVGFCDGVPIINMGAGTIGWNNGPSVAYTFADNTWYTIEYKVNGNTDIYVNGAYVGTLDGAMPGNLYGSFYASYVSLVSYSDGNDYALYEDFSDGSDDVFSTDLSYFTEVGEKYDLGMKYWMYDDDNAYVYATGAANADSIALDMCLESGESGFRASYFGDGIVFGNDFIGVGGATIAYNFEAGVWYHLEWVDAGSNVEIYVDGIYAGSVAVATIAPSGLCGSGILVGIDNFTVNGEVETFEDGKFNKFNYDGNGVAYDYTFEEIKEETIFDKLEASEAAGNAHLFENSWDGEAGYVEMGDKFANLGDNYIIDFDLALVPTNDSADGNYFELWTNWQDGGMNRFKVGAQFLGKNEDLVQFAWGEATKDNFHQVTLEFKNNRCTMYIDQVEVYSALCGKYADLSNMIVMTWNASAIIDNLVIVDGETFNVKADSTDIPTGTGYNRGNDGIKIVDLDADNFCAANEHITGKSVKDYDSTCYSEGRYSTYCGVCGEIAAYQTIALKDHSWAGYDINRTTSTGLVYTYCKASGCVEQRYTTLPTNYEGTLYQFYDMQDDMVLVVGDDTKTSASGLDYYSADGEQCWAVTEDGKLEFLGHAVYDEFHGIENSRIPTNNWSVSYDVTVDSSKHWVNEDGGVDHESFFLRCAGNAGYQLCLGWDRIDNVLFIRKFDGSKTFCTTPFVFEDGVEYNFMVTCRYEGYEYTHDDPDFSAPWYAEIAIWINGEKVLAYGDTEGMDAYSIYDIATGSDYGKYLKYPCLSQFGTSYTIDNLAFGSADFRIVKVLGDVDGDGELTAADALMMRKFLAGVIAADAFAGDADMNADGALNAKDQLLIRKALAA